MKLFMYNDRDLITILTFLVQFKRPCDSNRVPEKLALWILPNFMKAGLCASFNDLIVLIWVSRDAYAMLRADGDRIGTYVEAMNHVMKSYATNANTAKAMSETSRRRKMPIESVVQFKDAVSLKSVTCGNAYPDERIKKVFIDGLPI